MQSVGFFAPQAFPRQPYLLVVPQIQVHINHLRKQPESLYNMESRRIQREYEEISKLSADTAYGVSANIVNGDMTHWKGVIRGPVCLYLERHCV